MPYSILKNFRIALIAILLGFVLGWLLGAQTIRQSGTRTTYVSDDGRFFFDAPKGVEVSCDDGMHLCFLSNTGEKGSDYPDIKIVIDDDDLEVSFRAYKEREVEYFKDVVSSFRFLK